MLTPQGDVLQAQKGMWIQLYRDSQLCVLPLCCPCVAVRFGVCFASFMNGLVAVAVVSNGAVCIVPGQIAVCGSVHLWVTPCVHHCCFVLC